MKKIYFTVGPSQIYPKLPKYLKSALKDNILSLNHREAEFKNIFQSTVINLKKLLKIPSNYQIFFVSSALEAMERIILGTVEKDSFHIITGSFGKSWANIAMQLGKNAEKYGAEAGEGTDLEKLKIPAKSEVICITQNETSLGLYIPEEDIHNLKKRYPNKLIAVDIVSSVPYVDLDFRYIDIAFFSVQKGFGLPAGLGVMIVNPKALEKTEKLIKKGIYTGSFHSLKNLSQKAEEFQTPETPNVLNIYLLNEVIKDMLKIGIKKIREETNKKAELLYNFFENHKKYSPFVKDKKFRSPTTGVFYVKGKSEEIKKSLAKKGFIIASGYGDFKKDHIRIGNFPAHSLKNIHQMIKYLL